MRMALEAAYARKLRMRTLTAGLNFIILGLSYRPKYYSVIGAAYQYIRT